MYKLYTNINNAFNTPDPANAGKTYINYQEVGRVLTNYMLSVVSYKAPNVNTGLKSKWAGSGMQNVLSWDRMGIGSIFERFQYHLYLV